MNKITEMTALDFQDRMNPLTCMLIVCTRRLLIFTSECNTCWSLDGQHGSRLPQPLTHCISFYNIPNRFMLFSARKYVLKHWCGISWRFWECMGVDRRSLQWSTGLHQWSPVWWLFISLLWWTTHCNNGRYIMKCLFVIDLKFLSDIFSFFFTFAQ